NVLENTSSPNVACLVSRNGDLTGTSTVLLSSSATNHLRVPANVIVPAGIASAPFTATVLDDGVVGPDTLVTITAQASGYSTATPRILVGDAALPRLALPVLPGQVFQGQTVSATLSSDASANKPVTVSIVSSSPSALSVPNSVTIPANTNSMTFNLLAVQS